MIESIKSLHDKYKSCFTSDEIREIVLCDPSYSEEQEDGILSNYLCRIAADQKRSGKLDLDYINKLAINIFTYKTLIPNLISIPHKKVFDEIKSHNYPLLELYEYGLAGKVQAMLKIIKNEGVKVLCYFDDFIAIEVTALNQSKYFGDCTNWCTTNNKEEFWRHTCEGKYPLYVNLSLTKCELYQFTLWEYEFTDSQNNHISQPLSMPSSLLNYYESKIKELPLDIKIDVMRNSQSGAISRRAYFDKSMLNVMNSERDLACIFPYLTEQEKELVLSKHKNLFSKIDSIPKFDYVVKILGLTKMLQRDPQALEYIHEYSEELYEAIINNKELLNCFTKFLSSNFIEDIIHHHPEILKKSGHLLSYISDPTKDDILRCLKTDGKQIDCLFDDELTEEFIKVAIQQNPKSILCLVGKLSPEQLSNYSDLALSVAKDQHLDLDKFKADLKQNGILS